MTIETKSTLTKDGRKNTLPCSHSSPRASTQLSKFGARECEDPFTKVKDSITDLINRLQAKAPSEARHEPRIELKRCHELSSKLWAGMHTRVDKCAEKEADYPEAGQDPQSKRAEQRSADGSKAGAGTARPNGSGSEQATRTQSYNEAKTPRWDSRRKPCADHEARA